MTLPLWMYFVVAGIVVSAFMAIKTAREERKEEMEWIEKEGKIYMDRLSNEKEKRRKLKSEGV
ncbi:sporulation YhaL family protein [Aeribacillus pallidus]|jgi:hypothetical protein|uniref:sporulation YhaL family protein n=1 Tax=Aeribacillus pallidus TaxID=33936 RepID=UPI001DCA171D|nr:sporulation YhaL family protein [Bacillus sp. (in: firmicutes)]